jgi:hypothetical protein
VLRLSGFSRRGGRACGVGQGWRPYICRLNILMRSTWPSTAPELQGQAEAVGHVVLVGFEPVTNERRAGSPVAIAAFIRARESCGRRSFIMAAPKARALAVRLSVRPGRRLGSGAVTSAAEAVAGAHRRDWIPRARRDDTLRP